MKNNKGYSLTEVVIILCTALLILIVCVITYNKNFGNKDEDIGNVSIKLNINTDNVEDYEVSNEKGELELTKVEKQYKLLEEKMLNTAKNYISINYYNKNDQIIIKLSKLVEEEYMNEIVDPNNKDNTCNGYVIYDGTFDYRAYLNCKGNYKTEGYSEDFE